MIKRVIFTILLSWLAARCLADGDPGCPFIRNYLPDEYQGSPQNWAIVQDQRGVIYAGNDAGITEFAGKSWSPFIQVPNQSRIRSLAIDRRGIIYVGAVGDFGILAIDRQGKRSFVSFKNKLKQADRDFSDVWSIVATSRGVYFIALQKIFYWDYRGMTAIPARTHPFGFLVYDQVYINRMDGGICILAEKGLIPLPHTDKIPKASRVFSILPYGNQEILMVSGEGEFFIYDLKMVFEQGKLRRDLLVETISPSVLRPFPTEIGVYLNANVSSTSARLGDHKYVYGTLKGGIVIMDDCGKLVCVVNTNRGLQDNLVWAMLADEQQNLWAALNYGISYIETGSPFTKFNQFNNLKGIVISCAVHQGRLYAGTFDGIFYLPDYRMNSTDDKNLFLPVKNSKTHCFDFLSYHNHLLGLGNLSVYQINNAEAIPLVNLPRPICFKLSDRFPDYIFVGLGNGLIALKIVQNSGYATSNNNLTLEVEERCKKRFQEINDPIIKMACDQQGNLWLTTEYNGILHLEFWGSDVTHFKVYRYTTAHGLPGLYWDMVHFIDNRIVVGTERGIYQAVFPIGAKAGKAKIRFIPDSILNKSIPVKSFRVSRLFKDINNKIWLMSSRAIGTLTPQTDGSFQWDELSFRKIKGQIYQFFVDDEGVAWICGIDSRCLFRFDGNIKKNYSVDYSTLIRQVKAGRENKLLFAGNYYDPASREGNFFNQSSLVQPPELMIRFPYRSNQLAFEFDAAFYEQSEDNLFQHKLEGFDEKWSDWSSETKKEYSNLYEGSYRFQVKARNIFGHESTQASYRFSISPPWYRTIWAYLGYVLLLGFFFYGGIRLNSRRLIAARVRLERIVTDRTQELLVKNKEISWQKDQILKQKEEVETYAGELYTINRQLTETRNALWGEMELAKKIQTILLPEQPQIPGYEIVAYMKPADEVGGDYYDVINCVGASRSIGTPLQDQSPLHWIVIGDVSGHGVPAGLVMMMTQTSLHSVLKCYPRETPEFILKKVNQVIYENIRKLGEDKYTTITLLSVQPDGRILFSGLHQDIMIYRTEIKEVELRETQGMWIGIINEIDGMIGIDELRMNPGDVMLLYTDGIPEAVDRSGEMFSEIRLQQLFAGLGSQTPEEIKNGILLALETYTCKDDVTMMIIRRAAQ